MKLTDIDLSNREEIAAAHALLAAILGDTVTAAPSAPTTGAALPIPVLGQPPSAALSQDPAAVFGAQSAGPLPPALSSAAAGLPTNVPAGLPLSLPGVNALPGLALPPAPADSAPNAGAAPSTPAPGVELDSRGLPWDARIHASTKSKKKDGSWTALRGLNDGAKVAQIEAELRAAVQGAAPLAPPASTLPGIPAQPTGLSAQLPGMNGPASSGGNAQPGVTSPPGSGAADPVTFEQLMPRVTQATIAQILPATALQQVCATLGLPNVVALQTNPAYVPHAWAQLKAAYPALQ